MSDHGYTGLEFMEGFSLLAGVLWVIGALAIGAMVMIGSGRAGPSTAPAANQTTIGEMPATQ